jgi:amino acid permease
MALKFDIRNFAIIIILGLALVTLFSVFLHQYFPDQISALKTGKAFIILAIAFFLIMIFLFSYDKKLERSELISIIFVALALAGGVYALKKFIPEIFSTVWNGDGGTIFSALGR